MNDRYEPARTIETATPALDFETPLPSGDPRWVDLSHARGDQTITRLRRLFERKPAGRHQHALFASHRGAGKSTELNRFAASIRNRYLCLYLEANVEMDANEFSIEDLQLVLARAVEQQMREEGLALSAEVLERVEAWFSETIVTKTLGKSYLGEIRTSARATGGVPFFAELLANLTALFRVESEHRKQVKSALQQFPGTLTAHLNRLLDEAGKRLAESDRELLVIIDNMDRYPPRLIDHLLVQESDRFRQLHCNMVLTPPISLLYKPTSQPLDALFKTEVMPTARLRNRWDDYREFSGPGREALLQALSKRIDLDRVMPDQTAQNRLVMASGGAIRELLEIAQLASLEPETTPITAADVERVLERRRQKMRDRIDANGWLPTLARIAQQKRLTEDPRCLDVLFQRFALYYNGELWYDVHPLIAEIPDFQRALQDLDNSGGTLRG